MSDLPETDTGAAFAAGMATATAEQAAEQAASAEYRAAAAEDQAALAADAALRAAAEAETDAWSARAAVDELRGEVFGRLDELADLLRGGGGKPAAAGESDADVPAPERKEAKPADPAAAPPAGDDKERGYGAKSWFRH